MSQTPLSSSRYDGITELIGTLAKADAVATAKEEEARICRARADALLAQLEELMAKVRTRHSHGPPSAPPGDSRRRRGRPRQQEAREVVVAYLVARDTASHHEVAQALGSSDPERARRLLMRMRAEGVVYQPRPGAWALVR